MTVLCEVVPPYFWFQGFRGPAAELSRTLAQWDPSGVEHGAGLGFQFSDSVPHPGQRLGVFVLPPVPVVCTIRLGQHARGSLRCTVCHRLAVRPGSSEAPRVDDGGGRFCSTSALAADMLDPSEGEGEWVESLTSRGRFVWFVDFL